MADTHQQDCGERADTLTVLLCLVGLAGLFASAAVVAGGAGLWPSFSGERVYAAAQVLAVEEDVPVAPRAKAPAVAVVAEKMHRVTRACGSTTSRAKETEAAAAPRRKETEASGAPRANSRARARQLSRRPATPPAPNV